MKFLTIDEMIEVARDANIQGTEELVSEIEEAATRLAALIALRYKIQSGSATAEGLALAGTCAPFWPITSDQPQPEAFAGYDSGGEWEPRRD